jgi:protein SCO1/2
MRAKSFTLFLGLIGTWMAVPAAIAALHEASPHDAPSTTVTSNPSSRFDEKAALTLSQGVIGKEVGNITLTTVDGRQVHLSDFRGKPLVISLVYTSCYHICPTTTQYLAKVVRTARDVLGPDSFRVLTIGFDTPNDTPEAMRRFAQDQNLNIPQWEFLSADSRTMQGLTSQLGFVYFSAPHGFDHLIQATVVDAQGKIYRQVYGMNFDTPLLVEPLKELVFGAPTTPSLFSGLSNKIKLFCTVYDPSSDRYRFDYSIFMGIIIGLTSIGAVVFFLIREWRRGRKR